jgi:hypothetical protein
MEVRLEVTEIVNHNNLEFFGREFEDCTEHKASDTIGIFGGNFDQHLGI